MASDSKVKFIVSTHWSIPGVDLLYIHPCLPLDIELIQACKKIQPFCLGVNFIDEKMVQDGF